MNAASTAGVAGNYIGTNFQGTAAIPNAVGVSIGGTSQGGGSTLQGNLISGNTGDGVLITTSGQTMVQNTIGLGASGSTGVPNGGNGVEINGSTATGNVIGSTTGHNVIAANAGRACS